jgi:hypothetical protein
MRLLLALSFPGLVAILGCRTPTQITVEVTSDGLDRCDPAPEAIFVVGTLGGLAGRPASASTRICDATGPRTLVVVPSSSKSGEVAVEIVAGVDTPVEECAARGYQGCIVARRALRFLPHTPLRLPIALRRSCIGVRCAEADTCVRGVCVPATIGDPESCAESDCGPDLGPPVDAGPDGSDTSFAPDATADGNADGSIVEADRPDADALAESSTEADVLDGGAIDADAIADAIDADAIADASPPRAVEIGAGYEFSCARFDDGSVRCWGSNADGHLGRGTENDVSLPAAKVIGLPAAAQLAVGDEHSCVITRDAKIWCWGKNAELALGRPTGGASGTPAEVSLPAADPIQVEAGTYHTCVRHRDGAVFCWGSNNLGQLGDDRVNTTATPTRVLGIPAAIDLATSGNSTCIRTQAGEVWCWGFNDRGQCGRAASTSAPATKVVLPRAATGLALGFRHACANLGSEIFCWGANDVGQLRSPSVDDDAHPTPRSVYTGAALSLGAGHGYTCALLGGTAIECWGGREHEFFQGRTPAGLVGAGLIQVAADLLHACVVRSDGTVWCWGANGRLQRGRTIPSAQFEPFTATEVPFP